MEKNEIKQILDKVNFKWDKGENWNKRQVRDALANQPWTYLPQDKFTRGIPDIIFMDCNGKINAIELKMMGKSWTKNWALQERNLYIIGEFGFAYLLIVTKTDGYVLEQFKK